jgi:hypothetical protein
MLGEMVVLVNAKLFTTKLVVAISPHLNKKNPVKLVPGAVEPVGVVVAANVIAVV